MKNYFSKAFLKSLLPVTAKSIVITVSVVIVTVVVISVSVYYGTKNNSSDNKPTTYQQSQMPPVKLIKQPDPEKLSEKTNPTNPINNTNNFVFDEKNAIPYDIDEVDSIPEQPPKKTLANYDWD